MIGCVPVTLGPNQHRGHRNENAGQIMCLIINYLPFYQYPIIGAVWRSEQEDEAHTGSLYIDHTLTKP